MDKLLLDTDVILDCFFDRQPFSLHAARVLSLCELQKAEGFVTPVICSNAYYLLRQEASHDKVIEKLIQLLTITGVLDMNKEIINVALHSGFRDFEDALQNYAAESYGDIDFILTRNTKDYKKSSLSVMTPESYLKLKS